jgi:hypothetical protein
MSPAPAKKLFPTSDARRLRCAAIIFPLKQGRKLGTALSKYCNPNGEFVQASMQFNITFSDLNHFSTT